MIVFERCLRSMIFRIFNAREKHYRIMSHKKAFQKLAFDPMENMHEQSLHRLKTIIEHAWGTSPYYRDLWKGIGFAPNLLRDREDIEKLPFITKNDIEKHKNMMISETFDPRDLELSYTGGSSGTPTSFYRDRKATSQRIGRQLGILERCGYSVEDRCGLIWGAHLDVSGASVSQSLKGRFRRFAIGRETLCCTVLSTERMLEFHKRLERFRPAVLYGYPSAMGRFAAFVRDEKLAPIRVKTIICTAERLTDEQRTLLHDVFGGEVFNLYCTREHGCVAFECKNHHGFHIDTGSVYLEIVSNGTAVPSGQPGEIVITDLLNRGMPFIRYRIGDRGILVSELCDCGCKLPLLARLDGRVSDMLYRPDGSVVSGVMLVDLFMDEPAVKEIQIVQDSLHAVNLILVVGNNFNEDHRVRAIQRMKSYMGEDVKIGIKTVTEIPRNPISGKYQEVICRINFS